MTDNTMNGTTGTVETSKKEISRQEKQEQIRKAFKEFKLRDSVIKDIDEHGNLGAVCRVPLIALIISVIAYAYCFLFHENAAKNRMFIYWVYSKPGTAVLIWMVMISSILFLFFPAFCLWANLRKSMPKTGLKDHLFLGLYVAYMIGLYVIFGYAMCAFDLGPVASVFISIEQIRVTFKVHSFTREGALEIFKCEKAAKDDKMDKVWRPEFGKFLYFMFAPTVIYCDHYPRTESVNWKRFFYYFFAFLCCTPTYATTAIVLGRIYAHDFMDCPVLSFKKLAYSILIFTTSNPTVLTSLAYGFWHCYNNAWAEIMRFGDRHFYGDYWNGTCFREFMAKWAAPLHVWFHLYIYMDLTNIFPMRRNLAMMMTMVISAVIHDYVVFAICKQFFPAYDWIMFICAVFFPRVFFIKIKKPSPALVWCLTSLFQVLGGHVMYLKILYDVNFFHCLVEAIFGSIRWLLLGY